MNPTTLMHTTIEIMKAAGFAVYQSTKGGSDYVFIRHAEVYEMHGAWSYLVTIAHVMEHFKMPSVFDGISMANGKITFYRRDTKIEEIEIDPEEEQYA